MSDNTIGWNVWREPHHVYISVDSDDATLAQSIARMALLKCIDAVLLLDREFTVTPGQPISRSKRYYSQPGVKITWFPTVSQKQMMDVAEKCLLELIPKNRSARHHFQRLYQPKDVEIPRIICV